MYISLRVYAFGTFSIGIVDFILKFICFVGSDISLLMISEV